MNSQRYWRRAAAGVAEIRRIVDGLCPAVLEREGLLAARTACALTLSGASTGASRPAVTMSVHGGENLESLPPDVELAAYRIAVEAMTNAARHSGAHRVDTFVTIRESLLTVQTSDDGRGLPASTRSGTGLASMRRRARDFGGVCVIAPGRDGIGTTVTARLPVPEA